MVEFKAIKKKGHTKLLFFFSKNKLCSIVEESVLPNSSHSLTRDLLALKNMLRHILSRTLVTIFHFFPYVKRLVALSMISLLILKVIPSIVTFLSFQVLTNCMQSSIASIKGRIPPSSILIEAWGSFHHSSLIFIGSGLTISPPISWSSVVLSKPSSMLVGERLQQLKVF